VGEWESRRTGKELGNVKVDEEVAVLSHTYRGKRSEPRSSKTRQRRKK
jgi:hypothetical protein